MKKQQEFTLKDLFEVFIPKLWLIVLIGLVLALVAAVKTEFVDEDTYTSYSLMYVYRDDQPADVNDLDVADHMIEIYTLIIRSDDFLNSVINDLSEENQNLTPAYLRNVVSISRIGNATFKISVTTTDAALSCEIATAIEDKAYVEISKRIPNSLRLLAPQSPTIAKAPDSKGTIKNAAIFFAIGAAVAIVLVWVLNLLDVTIHNKKKLVDTFDIPVLAVIPRHVIHSKSKEGDKKHANV